LEPRAYDWLVRLITCACARFGFWQRIFKKFELQAGEVVRFNDFLRSLPKSEEQHEDELDEEEMDDPKQPIV
jgi:hypothetical protein